LSDGDGIRTWGLGASVLKAVLLNIGITYPYNDFLERLNITFGDI